MTEPPPSERILSLCRSADSLKAMLQEAEQRGYQRGRREGREEGREEAAKACTLVGHDWEARGDSLKSYAADYLADYIRSLPLHPAPGGGK